MLQSFFDTSVPAHVTVIGDTMVDQYIYGNVSRISPEGPVPVFRHTSTRSTVGGAGNVAANIVTLGGSTSLVCLTGQDAMRTELLKLCDNYEIATDGMLASDTRCTTTKTRFMSSGQQMIRYDQEDATQLEGQEKSALLNKVEAQIANTQCVVISDYGKGVFTKGFAKDIIDLCKAKQIPVIVDPKTSDYTRYQGATVVTPNLKELCEAVGRNVYTDEEVTEAGRELIEKYDLDYVLSTRSEKGMSIIASDTALHIPTYAREVFDVSGAGDTVVAALALGLAKGVSREDAANIANAAAGVAVSKHGTARISASEVRRELKRRHVSGFAESSVLSIEEAQHLIDQWKSEGHKVGFTNGCFDILHYGHTSILERTRAKCDKLVVGLNSDASTTRLKGPSRPINSESSRANVLASLRSVDAVVIFDEDTPLQLIEALTPSVLVKGADYTVETTVGAEHVISHGGEVLLLDLIDGHSTTAIIEKSSKS